MSEPPAQGVPVTAGTRPTPPPAPKPRNNARAGISWMIVASLMLTGNHATVRYVSHEIHAFEVTFFRNLLGVAFVMPMLAAGRFTALRTKRPLGHLMRALLNAGFMLTYYLGLSMAPLAEATALSFTGPIFASVIAALVLKEKLNRARVAALAVGFLGVLVIARPGFDVLSIGAILVLASSFFNGAMMVSIRGLALTESSLTITSYVAIFLVPITFVPALAVWTWPTAREFAILGLMALFATGGQLALARACREAETSTIMPFDFTRLLWASLIGISFYGETTDAWLWGGGALIFAGAILASPSGGLRRVGRLIWPGSGDVGSLWSRLRTAPPARTDFDPQQAPPITMAGDKPF